MPDTKQMLPMLTFILAAAFASVTFAAWEPPAGVDLTRPRILFRQDDLRAIQARLEREPYRGIAVTMMQRVRLADGVALDDDGIDSHRRKSRAAKNLAFFYAVDRTVIDGRVVPFATPEERQAVGDRVRELLANLYPRSRLAVAPPLGGWDRDISTSEELLQYATAYDAMLGAGYDFGGDGAVIVERLVSLAAELYDNYVNPATAGTFVNLHNNNHRSKSGAALAAAGVVLAEHTPAAESDPRRVREPALWIDYGLDQLDLIMRYVVVTGDGAYAEGPFYFRFAAQNIIPFARAWDRLLGGRTYAASTRGLEIPSLWRHPLYRRGQRWQLDLTLPDGSLAPIDDGNPGVSYYFGLAPDDGPLSSAFAWRWINAPHPYDTEGNVDLGADAIVVYDDAVTPAPPAGSPTAFYHEGGNAIFRSDWSTDAVVAVVLAEHDTASLFGRDRDGRGVGPQGHEHAEPGAFLLHAFGERLLLDPGYFSFGQRLKVAKPEDHNIVLVDGAGPIDYVDTSISWRNRLGRPPIDGNAMLARALDSGFLDAATVVSRYGQPFARAAEVERRFLFADDRYLVIADDVIGPTGPPRVYTWLLHGNGGETSGGSFERTPLGGRWTRAAARLDSALLLDGAPPAFDVVAGIHETAAREERTHAVLRGSAQGDIVRALQLIYPSKTSDSPPVVTELQQDDLDALVLVDEDGGRRVLAARARDLEGVVEVDAAAWDGPAVASDATLILVDARADASLRLAWAENATALFVGDVVVVTSAGGNLGVRAQEGRLDIVADTADDTPVVFPPFAPVAVDGACVLRRNGYGGVTVTLGRDRRFSLRSSPGNAVPAADPGPDRVVGVGETLGLDGSESCDADGDELTPSWQLISAPAGSAWRLDDVGAWTPALLIDRPGPYRVRLTVTDAAGAQSLPVEALIIGGDIADDGIDNDLDGLFDSDDPDADAGAVCAGDCTAEGEVTVDELVRVVEIALGVRRLDQCFGIDMNGDGRVTVEEIVAALTAALKGCVHELSE